MKVKNVRDLQNKLESSDSIREEFEKDPLGFMLKIEPLDSIANKTIFLTIVYFVGLALLGCILAVAVLSYTDPKADINDLFVMIASAAVGALAGLIVPNPSE